VDATSDSFITLAQKIQLPNFLSGLKSSDDILKVNNPFA
jgi:hypothetical protein